MKQQRPLAELRTVRDFLRFAVSRFTAANLAFGHGCDNAYDEAAYLVLHTLHLPPETLEPFLDARLTRDERAAVLRIIERRIDERIPAAYLTHEAWLGEFRFYVDERVLVPRSHIAELLRDGLAPWLPEDAQVRSALDLCTGSSCLAILLAHTFPEARIDAADISRGALAVAERNVADYALTGRVDLIRSDLFAALRGRRYDVIVSNPPYVTEEAMQRLPAEYRHEPSLALAAGADGMDVVRRIVREARRHLNPGGLLVVEVGGNRDQAQRALGAIDFIWPELDGASDSVFLVYREQLPKASRTRAKA